MFGRAVSGRRADATAGATTSGNDTETSSSQHGTNALLICFSFDFFEIPRTRFGKSF
jgi:hypothetical protein